MRASRKGVSTMIGGIIILAVLLTALTTMVYVGQQYDAYQKIVSGMSQKDVDRFSENLVANYPGLVPPSGTSACGTNTCYKYIMSLSNVGGLNNAQADVPSGGSGSSGGSGGGIGVQIARIYINTTVPKGSPTAGCAPQSGNSPCILNPVSSATAYGFLQTQAFLNPGEFSHTVTLWLPSSNGLLPNPDPPTPQNTIWIITTRGRVFSFQWPFPPTGQALQAVNAAVATGTMKIAYTGSSPGYSSTHEPSWGGSATAPYCHTETPPASDMISAGTYGTLDFVNPWIIDTILGSGIPTGTAPFGDTILYIYAKYTNAQPYSISITMGSLLISVSTSTNNKKVYFLGGSYVGGVAGGGFVQAPTPLVVGPTQQATAIFQIQNWNVPGGPGGTSGVPGTTFAGFAAVSNAATGSTYYGATLLLDGLYVRTSCTQA